jgi:hypothetical protein
MSEKDKHWQPFKLDDCDEAEVQYGAAYPGEKGIYITCMDNFVYLNAKQSLSLLAWLAQEKLNLEELTKEDSTLDKITRDVQRVVEDKPSEQIISEMLGRYGFDPEEE